MSDAHTVKQRIAARDALTARTRRITGAALTTSALLSGVFAGIAAASAPGHKLLTGAAASKGHITASTRTNTIPPLPAPAGPGVSAAPPVAAAAPSATQAPPVVVSGGS